MWNLIVQDTSYLLQQNQVKIINLGQIFPTIVALSLHYWEFIVLEEIMKQMKGVGKLITFIGHELEVPFAIFLI